MSTNNIPDGCEPFDLQRALAGVPVVTRDGREAKEITRFDTTTPSLAAVINGTLYTWAADGHYYTGQTGAALDLFLRPVPLGLQVKRKGECSSYLVGALASSAASVYIVGWGWVGVRELLNKWTQLDGTPCGRREV